MMSTRERWMVYPLLLLSVALALRVNLNTESSSGIPDSLICQELVVCSPDGATRVHIGNAASDRAFVRLFTPAGEEAVMIGVTEDESTGQIETRRRGKSQTQLGGDQEGGHLLLSGAAPEGVGLGTMAETRLKVGHDADLRITGLMIVDPDGVPLAEVGDDPSPWGFWAPWDLRWQATPAMNNSAPSDGAAGVETEGEDTGEDVVDSPPGL